MKKQLYLLLLTFICAVQVAKAQYAGAYYNPIDVTEPHNLAQTNFPVLITVNTQALISAGQMQASGADIRFASNTFCPVTATFLDYYIESGINTPTTNIWVRLPSLAAGATATIYMIYGDPAATATSSFALTFPNALVITSGTTTLTGTQNVGWLQVDAGATLAIQQGAPLTVRAERVIINGTIMGDGRGYLVPSGTQQIGTGPGGGTNSSNSGAGGGSYGGVGGTGGLDAGDSPGVGGPVYGTLSGTDIDMGSTGGNGAGASGNGGGAIAIYGNLVTLNGSVTVNGMPGAVGSYGQAGGGAAGGGVLIRARSLMGSGSVSAAGGAGGSGTSTANDGGGGGAGGRIKFFTANTPSVTTNITGGVGGVYGDAGYGQPGGVGTVYTGTATFTAPVIGAQAPSVETPDATLSISPSNTICAGETVMFTTNVVLGGVSPSFQWFINGAPIFNSGNTYTSTSLSDGDSVSVVMTTTGLCTATPTDTTNGFKMTVNPLVTPYISVSASPGTTVCDGTPITYTANILNGGTTPVFQWAKNGVILSVPGSVYNDNAVADGDSISVILVSNVACATSPTATSNDVLMTVTPNVTPDVTITVTPSSSICDGTIDTFIASTVNGGTAPVLQWFSNGVLVSGTDSMYINNSPVDGDSVFCVLTSNETCLTVATDTSNRINMTVTPTNTLAGAVGTTETYNINVTGTTQVNYTDCDVMATITANGLAPVSGNIVVGVTIDDSVSNYNGQPYVERHYDIEPDNAPSTSTATVTLYAYQSEFDAYNVVATAEGRPLLPTGGVDNGNVKITQYHGAGTAPGNYTGAAEVIIPAATWNAVNNWWELTFPVTGFSGFYIYTSIFDAPLAITLQSIKATNIGAANRIDWETASEATGDIFTLERSIDGKTFTALTTIAAKGIASAYSYNDVRPVAGVNYYRIKMTGVSGKSVYSNVVNATVTTSNAFTLQAYPNPAEDRLTVSVSGTHGGNGILTIIDIVGRVVKKLPFSGNQTSVDISSLTAGSYTIRYTDDVNTTTVKISKK